MRLSSTEISNGHLIGLPSWSTAVGVDRLGDRHVADREDVGGGDVDGGAVPDDDLIRRDREERWHRRGRAR